MSNAIMGYWTSFVRTDKPQAAGEPGWPAYTPDGPYIAFEATPMPSVNLLPGMYQLHEEVVCRRRAAGNLA